MIELKHSDVVFNEAAHTYTKGAEKLSGITSLIHSVLRLGVYPKADQETIEVRIPRAGYYGKCVHEQKCGKQCAVVRCFCYERYL